MGAAVPQLEVVQHRVVIFGETLVCVLDGGHIGAHLVGVVRHLDNSLVGVLGRRGGVPAKALKQGGRKARYLLHVAVGRYTGRPECLIGRRSHLGSASLKQRFNAADALLNGSALGHRLAQRCANPRCGNSNFDCPGQLAADARTSAGYRSIPADGLLNPSADASSRWDDLHIRGCHIGCHTCHLSLLMIRARARSKSAGVL